MISPSHDPSDDTTVIYHVLKDRSDLLPQCGQLPGDERMLLADGRLSTTVAFFHSICLDAPELLAHAANGRGVCSPCFEFAKKQCAPHAPAGPTA